MAFVARPDGSGLMRGEKAGPDSLGLGRALAEDFLSRGAAALLGR